MSPPPDERGSVGRITLKRADIFELIRADALLRAAPFVKAIGAKAEALLKNGIARRYPDRAVLFQTGDAGNSLFLVLNGEVRLSGRKDSDVVELGTAGRGEVFGEPELLSGGPQRFNSAVAHGDVEAAEIPREALLEKGLILKDVAEFLRPLKEARLQKLSEMTDFMSRW